MSPIHLLQKKIVRLITSKGPYTHSPPLFQQAKLLNIFDIHKLKLGKIVYEIINNQNPMLIEFNKSSNIHYHETRYASGGNLYVNYNRTTKYGLNNIQTLGSKMWTSIPINIQISTSSSIFKKRYKEYLLTLYN